MLSVLLSACTRKTDEQKTILLYCAAGIKPAIETIAKNNDFAEMKNFSNDLQYYAFKAYPVLKKVINALNSNKSFFSRMTCFAFKLFI